MVYERSDLASDLPENTPYQDEGCFLSNSCLECPFPCCIHDLPGGATKLCKQSRNKEIIRLAKKGIKTKDLAIRFRLSQRNVQMIVQKAK
ncbi:MAG: hypothetical protein JW967_08475 [Dehalococcoidales bacterium]|nr:hypothetical protein [Dehalococcoidales bacterium]